MKQVKHLCASSTKILIDDHEPNVDGFRDHGGAAVLVPRPWNKRKPETCAKGGFDAARLAAELEGMVGL